LARGKAITIVDTGPCGTYASLADNGHEPVALLLEVRDPQAQRLTVIAQPMAEIGMTDSNCLFRPPKRPDPLDRPVPPGLGAIDARIR
jgi:hypothetical protein